MSDHTQQIVLTETINEINRDFDAKVKKAAEKAAVEKAAAQKATAEKLAAANAAASGKATRFRHGQGTGKARARHGHS